MIDRWQDEPRLVRAVVGGFVLLLAYGTFVHLLQLVASGFAPYPGLPGWLRAYFTALILLDPLAAVLLARRLRSGVVLTATVLVSDAAANGWANYALDDTVGITTGRVAQAVITMLAVALIIALPCLWRTTASGRHPSSALRSAAPRRPAAELPARRAWTSRDSLQSHLDPNQGG